MSNTLAEITARYSGLPNAPYATLTVNLISQDIVTNTSEVEYILTLHRPSLVTSVAKKDWKVEIDNKTIASGTTIIGGVGDKIIKSDTIQLKHSEDGTLSAIFSFYLELDILWSNYKLYSLSRSGIVVFPIVYRGSAITLDKKSVNMGNPLKITLDSNSDINYTLRYKFKNAEGTIITNLEAASYNWIIPIDLANQIPSSTSDVATLYCDTYFATSYLGTKSVNVTLNVPSSVIPVISNIETTEATEAVAAKFNAFVQSHSSLNVSVQANGVYGSTITKCVSVIQGVQYLGQSFTSEIITNSGTISIASTVTDSRGRQQTFAKEIDVINYHPPVITSFKAWRVNDDGIKNDNGTKIAVQAEYEISPINQLNDHTYDLSYGSDSPSTTFDNGSANWSYSGTQTFTGIYDPVISIDNSWLIKLTIEDFWYSIEYTVEIPTSFNLLDFRYTGKGLAIGKASEKDCLEIAIPIEISGDAKFVQETPISITLLNNWEDFGTEYEEPSYWKDDFGTVHVAGLIKGGLTAAETVLFTLPDGYRPRAKERFICPSAAAVCHIDLMINGDCVVKSGANADCLSLSGISFRAAEVEKEVS